jgi:hypothetical protein
MSKKSNQPQVDIELIFKVIENRGYQRDPSVPSMNDLIYEKVKHLYDVAKKIDELVEALQNSGVSYVIIGGIAVLLHGGRASTLDFDLYVLASDTQKLKESLVRAGSSVEFQAEHRLRLIYEGIQVDILETDHVLAETIFLRAVTKKIVSNIANIASPEDLIILKTLADRPIDRRDVEELREIFQGRLNQQYIDSTLLKYKI